MGKRAWVLLGCVAGCTTLNPEFDGADATSSDDTWGSGTRGSTSSATNGSTSTATTTTATTTTGTTTTSAGTTTTGTSTGTTAGDDDDDDGSTGPAETSSSSAAESSAGSSSETGSDGSGSSSESSGESTTGCTPRRWYLDGDEDGFGGAFAEESCERPTSGSGPYVRRGGDCDDEDDAVHPAATEVCANEVDDDCSGAPDDALECSRCEPLDEEQLWLCEEHSWDEASPLCGRFSGRLAVTDTEAREQTVVEALEAAGVDAVWIGLSRGGAQPFRWLTGAVPQDYVNWLGPEPDPGPRLCVTLAAGDERWGWVAEPCGASRLALCERVP